MLQLLYLVQGMMIKYLLLCSKVFLLWVNNELQV